jgi:hypothetical protein
MTRSSLFFTLVSALLVSRVVGADNSAALDALRNARVITCKFTRSAKTDFKNGELKSYQSTETHELAFDQINFQSGSARMVSTGGQIGAFLSNGGATFYEGPGFDNHSFTTISPVPSHVAGEYVAVHSVHSLYRTHVDIA